MAKRSSKQNAKAKPVVPPHPKAQDHSEISLVLDWHSTTGMKRSVAPEPKKPQPEIQLNNNPKSEASQSELKIELQTLSLPKQSPSRPEAQPVKLSPAGRFPRRRPNLRQKPRTWWSNLLWRVFKGPKSRRRSSPSSSHRLSQPARTFWLLVSTTLVLLALEANFRFIERMLEKPARSLGLSASPLLTPIRLPADQGAEKEASAEKKATKPRYLTPSRKKNLPKRGTTHRLIPRKKQVQRSQASEFSEQPVEENEYSDHFYGQ